MKYKLMANAEIEADDLDGAFLKLAHYYLSLSQSFDVSTPFVSGEISLRRCRETTLHDHDHHASPSRDHS